MLEIKYSFREKDLIHYNELQIAQSEDLQKKLRKNRLFFPGVLAILGLFLWSYYSDYRTAVYVITIAICWAVVIPQVIILSFRRQILTSYTEKDEQHRPHQKNRGEPRYSRRLSSSCFLQDTCRVTHIVESVKSLVSEEKINYIEH
jgi:hypothetical protein